MPAYKLSNSLTTDYNQHDLENVSTPGELKKNWLNVCPPVVCILIGLTLYLDI